MNKTGRGNEGYLHLRSEPISKNGDDRRSEKDNPALYRYGSYSHCSDSIQIGRDPNTIRDPSFWT